MGAPPQLTPHGSDTADGTIAAGFTLQWYCRWYRLCWQASWSRLCRTGWVPAAAAGEAAAAGAAPVEADAPALAAMRAKMVVVPRR